MCALQMQAEYGPTLASNSAEFDSALEKFLVKQVRFWVTYSGQHGHEVGLMLSPGTMLPFTSIGPFPVTLLVLLC